MSEWKIVFFFFFRICDGTKKVENKRLFAYVEPDVSLLFLLLIKKNERVSLISSFFLSAEERQATKLLSRRCVSRSFFFYWARAHPSYMSYWMS